MAKELIFYDQKTQHMKTIHFVTHFREMPTDKCDCNKAAEVEGMTDADFAAWKSGKQSEVKRFVKLVHVQVYHKSLRL